MKHLHEIFMGSTRFADKQTFGGMTVFPVISVQENPIKYLSLKQALNQQLIVITEISQGGSVPNLKVINKGELPVLLLDGEEISGAKQNRILNATILLKEKSETVIPVSCTERGRWSYNKPVFEESGNMMAHKIRSQKMADVTNSLKSNMSYCSDQGKVWSEIDKMADRLEVQSRTDSMKDVYEATQHQMQDYVQHFSLLNKQVGVVVCIEDKIVGMDCLSSDVVWADLHAKLIKSYAIDCLNLQLKEIDCGIGVVHDFLHKFQGCMPQAFPSVGHGEDYRFESHELMGSGLFWQETIIHLALYSVSRNEFDTTYHSPRTRCHNYVE